MKFAGELRVRLGEVNALRLLTAPNRPLQALADLSYTVNALPVDEKRRVEMDKSIVLLNDALETCERIFASPVPLVYTRHTARQGLAACPRLLLPSTCFMCTCYEYHRGARMKRLQVSPES